MAPRRKSTDRRNRKPRVSPAKVIRRATAAAKAKVIPEIAPPVVRAAMAARAGQTVQDAILAGMLDPVLIIDGYGTIERASQSVERVFGYKVRELLGQNIKKLMPEPYRSEHDGYLAAYRTTGKSSLLGKTREFPIVRKDGAVIDCEMSVSRIDVRGRSDPIFTGSFRDVTERKRAAELAEAAARRERAMLKALATIGESSAILAHEIKNPITAINVALRAVADRLGSKDREVIDDLAARLRRVEAMIRRTLSFTRPVELKVRPITPKDLADVILKAVSLRIKMEKNVRLKYMCRAKERIEVDVELMTDVFVNLVSNAIEAADGSPVTIKMTCTKEGRDAVRMEVEDNGPGFPDSVLAMPFLPFVTTKETGTGLGLALCKKIIEEHGGSLSVHRIEPKGALLRIILPRFRES